MGAEVIYKMEYSRIDPQEEPQAAELEAEAAPGQPGGCFDEIYGKMIRDTTYILIPERIKAGERFIQTAIEVSQRYKLDTKIIRHDSHITVKYAFNCCGGMCDIRRVFGMADEFAFFKDVCGRDILVCMDYYTHAVVRNGTVVSPEFIA